MPKSHYSPSDQSLIEEGFLPWEEDEIIEMIRERESYRGDFLSVTDPNMMQIFTDAAHHTPISRTTIRLQVPNPVLSSFCTKAAQEGIPYQILLGSLMKKYSEGQLVERR